MSCELDQASEISWPETRQIAFLTDVCPYQKISRNVLRAEFKILIIAENLNFLQFVLKQHSGYVNLHLKRFNTLQSPLDVAFLYLPGVGLWAFESF